MSQCPLPPPPQLHRPSYPPTGDPHPRVPRPRTLLSIPNVESQPAEALCARLADPSCMVPQHAVSSCWGTSTPSPILPHDSELWEGRGHICLFSVLSLAHSQLLGTQETHNKYFLSAEIHVCPFKHTLSLAMARLIQRINILTNF